MGAFNNLLWKGPLEPPIVRTILTSLILRRYIFRYCGMPKWLSWDTIKRLCAFSPATSNAAQAYIPPRKSEQEFLEYTHESEGFLQNAYHAAAQRSSSADAQNIRQAPAVNHPSQDEHCKLLRIWNDRSDFVSRTAHDTRYTLSRWSPIEKRHNDTPKQWGFITRSFWRSIV